MRAHILTHNWAQFASIRLNGHRHCAAVCPCAHLAHGSMLPAHVGRGWSRYVSYRRDVPLRPATQATPRVLLHSWGRALHVQPGTGGRRWGNPRPLNLKCRVADGNPQQEGGSLRLDRAEEGTGKPLVPEAQTWIPIEGLSNRRPQVLLDVTILAQASVASRKVEAVVTVLPGFG